MSTTNTSSSSGPGAKFRLMDLPSELIIMVAENTSSSRDLLHLTMSNKFTYELLGPRLMTINIAHQNASGLNHAIRKNNIMLASVFLDGGADVNKACRTAAQGKTLEQEILRDIYKRTADTNPKGRVQMGLRALAQFRTSGRLDPPLYVAVSHGLLEMVYFLLCRGADPTAAAHRGYPSALARASYDWNEKIVALLVGALKRAGAKKRDVKEVFEVNAALGELDRGL
ncbi:uncharacterized protein DSM5745_05156 [Aspergillus mulundensis]|uniref:Uncharacterized protein n=1 Tax=Aspergillus mulundensis TaxID=1810919 RepID=A0A3D8S5N1_9EURO|nr:hypothetical protein DSM5745_05156 [Aspergillus mulundensis]RDW81599.1 hypothetical protein DSM5745_05156 [Aspergillus mulundensis]